MSEIDEVFSILGHEVVKYDVPVIDLIKVHSGDPYRILVATILSSRTQDRTTAAAAERLFSRAPSLQALSKLTVEEIGRLIYPVGFFRTKARHLEELPTAIRESGGKIPEDMEGLMRLPGVGRKTASLVLALAFDKDAICVDVHGHRIPNRLGWVETKTPIETEMAPRRILPRKYWKRFNRIFVAFGQAVCKPVRPHCWDCPVTKYCRYYRENYLKTS